MKKLNVIADNTKQVNIADLRSIVWQGDGWKRYWTASENMDRALKVYRSVSDLPLDTDVEDLKRVNQVLGKAAAAMEEAFMVIKKLKV